ncbi:hypothetical protein DAI22_06g156703 [Oryza sativa Japonica Group]|nr:hypothetical protein DAI22_06g156703 [Oryza sativa Japonica Group]
MARSIGDSAATPARSIGDSATTRGAVATCNPATTRGGSLADRRRRRGGSSADHPPHLSQVYENCINHGRGFRASGRNLEANRPTMAAAHTDPRSTMVSSQSITATTSGRNAYCTMSMVI